METNESTELLTDEDIVLINNFVEKPNLKLLIFMIFFTGLSYLGSLVLDTFIPLICFGIFTAIAAAWYIWMKSKIAKYTRSGTKKMITGILENKFERTIAMRQTKNFASSTHTFAYFLIEGIEYMVPYNYFTLFNQGENLTLHLTITDDIVFNVTK